MKPVLDWVARVAALVILMAWCGACIYGALQLEQMVGASDDWDRALAVLAAGAGLWFSLWSVARATHHRL